MGILNVTPDSFYVGSRVNQDAVVERAGAMLEDGANVLDIGGQSTRPGATDIGPQEEADRVLPAIEAIAAAFPEALLSVDTFHGAVAKQAIRSGAALINDISAGTFDPTIVQVAADLQVPYILMHMQGSPQTMQVNPTYSNPVDELTHWFSVRIGEFRKLGLHDLLIDPGFGFGKQTSHNYNLLVHLDAFLLFGAPLVVGVSRKRMIQEATGRNSAEALSGTTAAHTIALTRGASILRVHDVAAASDCINVWMETIKAV